MFNGHVPGAWEVPTNFKLTNHQSIKSSKIILPNLAFFIPDALSTKDCKLLRDLFSEQNKVPVAISGYQTNNINEIGSHRATGWGPNLGNQLWAKISQPINDMMINHQEMNSLTPTDWFGISEKRNEHKYWRPTNISPVLRFMEYGYGGKHNTHYDMGYDYEALNPKDERRTLLSIVWYLNEESNTGGATRFIEDNQSKLPIWERDLNDWTRSARADEILAKQEPSQGGALIFWHRMAHDVEEFIGNSRIIIRGDIEFSTINF